ncbi:MAG: mechanosensitive ion channel [Sphingobium sp.]|jgi:small-conductance mechanosensitive channel|uniref:Mechanosensitive ion channel protein MscS n=1 Tax=Sphingobium xenophagum TaxID=121428 RepID=A0A249MQF6_SPHXE|nr:MULTISPECIES: mechanosensitive ion channel domain-containing protein [Sphingobium]MBU0657749.1 mechanosensitive ion channel family protein [Alphaproteobacteria bacterium]ASY43444.1 mechanosensitive ion channel protein MscS [Sphingobium xenophagum]MBA4753498.1 mechanosensitive ion channel [Sphingobium sp.]MBS88885.1 mechanosensitive ion channel protein MscS [Sphingobium sp.]MBU0776066.1 mechanosensitive ion channel family protein [Alphaproteobacteria bacterium]|tara:strand:+ start:1363 stop:2511 length:1149 start_codon:yes stop_codon:yes gene_type:complete
MANTTEPAAVKVHTPDLVEMWRSTSEWLSVHYVQIAIAIGAGILIYLALTALRQFGKRWRGDFGDPLGYTNVLGRAVARTTHFFMLMVAAKLVAGYADPPAALFKTIAFLFTIAAVLQGAIWAREIILGLIERKTLAEDGQGETLANAMGLIRVLVTFALFAIATIVVLDNLGVNVTGLVAGLGIGGIAIGLAAQGIFSDLFAALSIIFDKPFRRGETITYDTTTATVEKIGLKSTRMRAITGEKKVMSNANLLQKEITSYFTLDHRRIKFAIGVIYQTPPQLAAQIPDILKEIIEAHGGNFVRSGFVNFGASSLDFEVEFDVYLPDWDSIYQVRHKVGLAILQRFNDAGLEFAYPTQTTFTAAPDGQMIMPYAEVQPVRGV